MADNTHLSLKGIKKSFENTDVLKGIDLDIAQGEFITLLGSSGCGKTTTIRIIAGLEMPDEGRVILDGTDITDLSPDKRNVNTIFQNYALFPHMNVADNISYGLKIRKVAKAERRAKAEEMLQRLGIAPLMPLKTLSKGNREKVQLILAMSRAAKAYLLDEPIGGVDPAARDYILETIIRNYSEDALVVISTHLIADVERILDEAVFLRGGKVVSHRTVDDIREMEGKSVDEYFREVFRC